MLRWAPDMGISFHGGPFPAGGNLELGGGALWKMNAGGLKAWGIALQDIPWRDHWGRTLLMGTPKVMSSKAWKWASASIGAPLLGNMEGHFFLRAFLLEEFLWAFREICKIPCKRASLSIGALLGNLEGAHLPVKRKEYLGSFHGPRGH